MPTPWNPILALIGTLAIGCSSVTIVPEEPRQGPPEDVAVQEGEQPGEGEGEQPGGDAAAEMQKAYEEAGKVGEHHEHLAMLEGDWTVATSHRPAPKAPESTSVGSLTNKLIMGGRYLLQDYAGEFEMGPGIVVQFQGKGLLGYDNVERRHKSFWIDNFGTGFLLQDGVCDEDGRLITMMGSYNDPTTPDPKTMRTVYRIENKDRFIMEMYMPDPEGNEFLSMTLVHVRKK